MGDQPAEAVCMDLGDSFQVLKQGAEAKIYIGTYIGLPVVVKERFPKKYRHPDLDLNLTKDRIRNEARSIARCKNYGIKTPCLYLVDMERRRIYMEHFTKNISVKDFLISTVSKKGKDSENIIRDITRKIGLALQKLHESNIIHGDLTTSNMLIVPKNVDSNEVNWCDLQNVDLALIDFGLSYVDASAEDKAVDLYVLERALTSTHSDIPDLTKQIVSVYKKGSKDKIAEVMSKYEEVRARGRKRTMVG